MAPAVKRVEDLSLMEIKKLMEVREKKVWETVHQFNKDFLHNMEKSEKVRRELIEICEMKGNKERLNIQPAPIDHHKHR